MPYYKLQDDEDLWKASFAEFCGSGKSGRRVRRIRPRCEGETMETGDVAAGVPDLHVEERMRSGGRASAFFKPSPHEGAAMDFV
ncbi:hypothetical protein [Paenibacillus sp. B01]|uniref:hypothetical protein n=1 Tax=Paenibacillus sp. B01 TaxID=2660554 RepID=UPI00129BA5C3|nr:hypothetical protein [Paenibacillus sp. B01]QGG57700.1 hypothetical protein GE073_20280 [Paenibacillus sp. B01]